MTGKLFSLMSEQNRLVIPNDIYRY